MKFHSHRLSVVSALLLGSLSVLGAIATSADAAAKSQNFLSVSCTPDAVQAGNPVTCTALDVGGSPATGLVKISATKVDGLSSKTCALTPIGNASKCSVTYTPPRSGTGVRTDKVSASYGGDSTHRTASGTHVDPASGKPRYGAQDTIVAYPPPTPSHFILSCPASIPAGGNSTCYAYDLDDNNPALPTGKVLFKSNHPTGLAGDKTCTLSVLPGGMGCDISYTPPGTGTAYRRDSITANYQGDSNWNEQLMSTEIAVPKAAN